MNRIATFAILAGWAVTAEAQNLDPNYSYALSRRQSALNEKAKWRAAADAARQSYQRCLQYLAPGLSPENCEKFRIDAETKQMKADAIQVPDVPAPSYSQGQNGQPGYGAQPYRMTTDPRQLEQQYQQWQQSAPGYSQQQNGQQQYGQGYGQQYGQPVYTPQPYRMTTDPRRLEQQYQQWQQSAPGYQQPGIQPYPQQQYPQQQYGQPTVQPYTQPQQTRQYLDRVMGRGGR